MPESGSPTPKPARQTPNSAGQVKGAAGPRQSHGDNSALHFLLAQSTKQLSAYYGQPVRTIPSSAGTTLWVLRPWMALAATPGTGCVPLPTLPQAFWHTEQNTMHPCTSSLPDPAKTLLTTLPTKQLLSVCVMHMQMPSSITRSVSPCRAAWIRQADCSTLQGPCCGDDLLPACRLPSLPS